MSEEVFISYSHDDTGRIQRVIARKQSEQDVASKIVSALEKGVVNDHEN